MSHDTIRGTVASHPRVITALAALLLLLSQLQTVLAVGAGGSNGP